MEMIVRPDVPAVAREAAERVIAAAARAIHERGRFTLVLSGGSTPAALYELLASEVFAPRIDWPRTLVFFGDERCVPPEHEWSNYAMARRTLLDRVPLPHDNVYRVLAENGPANAAHDYAATLAHVLAPTAGGLPQFDLVLLGMGDDGHTASLFPKMPALAVQDDWVIGTDVPAYVQPHVARVTLTLPVLNAARHVLFLVTGSGKAARVREVSMQAAAGREDDMLPAARVRPKDGSLTWLLDEPAAAKLER